MFKNQKISVDLRIVCAVLLAVIVALLVWTKPWSASSSSARTITINGEASVEAEPDEFQFSPTYQKKGTDRAAIQQELIAQVNAVIAKLKELGVEESDITLASSTYDNYWNDGSSEVTSNTLTINVDNKELSQKVQDYLITTSPEGQITPYSVFSNKKQKEVEKMARSEAIADAKEQAQKTADELGLKLGKVVSITDQQGGLIMPMMSGRAEASVAVDAVSSSLPVLPGKQDINYTVQVVYEIK